MCVGPKMSDVDCAKLPHLEDMSHSIVIIITVGSVHPSVGQITYGLG